jgi:hypothetical protein
MCGTSLRRHEARYRYRASSSTRQHGLRLVELDQPVTTSVRRDRLSLGAGVVRAGGGRCRGGRGRRGGAGRRRRCSSAGWCRVRRRGWSAWRFLVSSMVVRGLSRTYNNVTALLYVWLNFSCMSTCYRSVTLNY